MFSTTEIKKIDINNKQNFYFSGICGSGMSALAFALQDLGKNVSGSDRIIDQGKISPILQKIRRKKLDLHPQNGSGINADIDYLVYSTAIEEDNPEIHKAKELNVTVIHRTDLLLALIESKFQVAIAGSSGKTTTSALTAHLLTKSGLNSSYFIGGLIKGYKENESVYYHKNSETIVLEADESDRTIKKYSPNLGVILSVSKDHYGLKELEKVFYDFALQCKDIALINNDDARLNKIVNRLKKKVPDKVITFGIKNNSDFMAEKIKTVGVGSEFYVDGEKYEIKLAGLHNVYNALASVAAGKLLNLRTSVIRKALSTFQGVKRRFELVANFNGITVIDDFAHNPEKIKATILAARQISKRIILIYQPHGFYPVLINKNNLIKVWKENLRKDDILILPDIYYPGGKVEACADKVSSEKLIKILQKKKVKALYINDRAEIVKFLKKNAKKNDMVIVMGARDPSLSYFAKTIAKKLKQQ